VHHLRKYTGGSTPKSAGRQPTHLCQEVRRSRATKLSTLQLQVVPVVSGSPVPSDSAACGQDSGSRSTQPSSTLIFSSASFLCCYTWSIKARQCVTEGLCLMSLCLSKRLRKCHIIFKFGKQANDQQLLLTITTLHTPCFIHLAEDIMLYLLSVVCQSITQKVADKLRRNFLRRQQIEL